MGFIIIKTPLVMPNVDGGRLKWMLNAVVAAPFQAAVDRELCVGRRYFDEHSALHTSRSDNREDFIAGYRASG